MKRTASAAKKYNYDYIREAYRSFKKGNYSNSVIILEKASGAGLDEPYPVFLLALSYLYSGDYTKAENALLKIERTDPRYAPYIQLKSFLAMKGALTPVEALSAYISALEKLPADRMLKKGLLKIEKSADFYKLQKSARISSFVKIPSPGGKGFSFFKSSKGEFSSKKERGVSVKTGVKLSILLVTAIIISTAVFLYFYYDEIERMVFREQNGSRVIAGADKIDMINFEAARTLIKKGEFNKGIIILNRIMNSNSSYMVKEKAEFLIRYILESDERKFDNIEYRDITARPYLYRGAAINIKGRSANVKHTVKGTGLSILVGFDGKNFIGALDAFYKEKSDLKDGADIEVSGIFYPHIGENKGPFISIESLTVK